MQKPLEENNRSEEESISPKRVITFELDKKDQEPFRSTRDVPADEIKPVYNPFDVTVSHPVTPPVSQPIQRSVPVTPEMGPEMEKRLNERVQKLKALSEKLKNHAPIESNLQELESVPAYKRRNIELTDVPPSSESQVPKYSLTENPDKTLEINTENTFLHKEVD
jgi:cell division protein FtsZ